jgi:hypothetical protein
MNLQSNSESGLTGLRRGESGAFGECRRAENKMEKNGDGESGVWKKYGWQISSQTI